MKTMNENDKIQYLKELLQEGQSYQTQIWGTVMADAKTMLKLAGLSTIIGSIGGAMGALSNQYCYIGLTNNAINFVIVDSFNPSKVTNRFILPLEEIVSCKIKGSLFGRKVLKFKLQGGSLKLALMSYAGVGSDLQGQKEGVAHLCNHLRQIGKAK